MSFRRAERGGISAAVNQVDVEYRESSTLHLPPGPTRLTFSLLPLKIPYSHQLPGRSSGPIVGRQELGMSSDRGIALVYRKVPMESQTSDFAYWQTQPYALRLATLEQIRQEYHRWRGDAQQGLQRVYRIAKR